MVPPRRQSGPAIVPVMLCAATVTGQFVAGKATRDALFLAHLDVTSLPAMVIATSAVSMGFVWLTARVLRRLSPGTFVPLAFAVNASLLVGAWGLAFAGPELAARLFYLLVSGFGPILGSGFWLIAAERFDPRTAKQRFGQIAGIGTLGGLAGGLVAERVGAVAGVEAMLPILAAVNLLCAWQVRQAAGKDGISTGSAAAADVSPELVAEAPRSGLRVLAEAPYLRNLAAVVFLGTIGASLAEYAFKAEAVAALGRGDALLRFFAVYYAATSLLIFVVQTSTSRLALEKLGLAAATGSPSLALLAGGTGALLAPGLEGVLVARGAESVFRGSLFRSGYELFYTPILQSEKRAAKSLIDVGVDRLGDAVGAGLVRLVLLAGPAAGTPVILLLVLACSAAGLVFASRLNRGYIETLERSLLNRAVELDLNDAEDPVTRTAILKTLSRAPRVPGEAARQTATGLPVATAAPIAGDPDLQDMAALRSRDRDRITDVLRRRRPLPAMLVAHVIPLLAWDQVADAAAAALRSVADAHAGELTDALVDPGQPFAVRRRLARTLGACRSQRAADGLLLGLDDLRFEVRFQCGRALAAIRERNPGLHIDAVRVFEVVHREVAVGRPIWESHQLLDRLDQQEDRSFVDEFVKDRASQSLAHVFALLSLVLPREPLQIAYRGLYTDDQNLRGTALEYLEGVLPPGVRDRLWPFLDDRRPSARATRGRQQILDDLLRSNESIMLNLEELKRRTAEPGPARSKSWQQT